VSEPTSLVYFTASHITHAVHATHENGMLACDMLYNRPSISHRRSILLTSPVCVHKNSTSSDF